MRPENKGSFGIDTWAGLMRPSSTSPVDLSAHPSSSRLRIAPERFPVQSDGLSEGAEFVQSQATIVALSRPWLSAAGC